MAGIYLHIPFCKQKCTYCNFHFSTQTKKKTEFVQALLQEIALQKDYLQGATIETVYFGGGTPSLLTIEEVADIMDTLEKNFGFNKKELKECCFEVNPDDMNTEYLLALKNLGINRLSIGIQSFKESDLKYMNRAHNMEQSMNAIDIALGTGFDNISIDLIYGTPGLTNEEWLATLHKAIALKVPHISAYALTVEPQTKLDYDIKNKKTPAVSEELAAQHFTMLVATLLANGYEQYEISNFSLPGRYAVHNTNYWKQKKYLGLGPSAHSFNGETRQWNIANNQLYITSINKQQIIPLEVETLSNDDKFNEYVMTSSRTQWGIDLQYIIRQFGKSYYDFILLNVQEHINKKHALLKDEKIVLINEGKLFADQIASSLFH